jgi:hypothetical protein
MPVCIEAIKAREAGRAIKVRDIGESQRRLFTQHEADGDMPKHGTSLQLEGSRLLTYDRSNNLAHYLRMSFADLLRTAHLRADDSHLNLGMYLQDMKILRNMLEQLEYYFDEDGVVGDYQEGRDSQEDLEYDMFEYYKASKHCATHSSPEAEDALMERSGGYVFFFGEVYSLGLYGRRWAYKCELEDTLQLHEDRLRDYRTYADGLATGVDCLQAVHCV